MGADDENKQNKRAKSDAVFTTHTHSDLCVVVAVVLSSPAPSPRPFRRRSVLLFCYSSSHFSLCAFSHSTPPSKCESERPADRQQNQLKSPLKKPSKASTHTHTPSPSPPSQIGECRSIVCANARACGCLLVFFYKPYVCVCVCTSEFVCVLFVCWSAWFRSYSDSLHLVTKGFARPAHLLLKPRPPVSSSSSSSLIDWLLRLSVVVVIVVVRFPAASPPPPPQPPQPPRPFVFGFVGHFIGSL